jgi:hypothetical protein
MSKKVAQDLSRKLDQFYTNPEYALGFYKKISEIVDISNAEFLLEPSAGSGSFFNLFDNKRRIGLDLEPKTAGVIQQDFFTWSPPNTSNKIYTIGNPPFGKNANLAVKFFNHAAKFSEVISFILPRTFRKVSIQNRLDSRFHLIYDETVPDNSFIFNDQPYDVWCCAQIWIKKTDKRDKVPILNFNHVERWFKIVDPHQADFAIQRVGGRAGMIRTKDFQNYSKQSHYFIKQHDAVVLDIFKKIDFEPIKVNTAGNPSISPNELISLWCNHASAFGIDMTKQ